MNNCCCSASRLNTGGSAGIWSCVLTNAFPRVRGLLVSPFFITPTHGQPHTIFGGFISISGGWMELIVSEDSPHITVQCITSYCSLSVVLTEGWCICEKSLEMCIWLWPEFDCPEVTLCGWQDITVQLLLLLDILAGVSLFRHSPSQLNLSFLWNYPDSQINA